MKRRDFVQPRFVGRPPREAPPPSRYGQSRSGNATFTWRKAPWRNIAGEKLYRLGFYGTDDGRPQFSTQLWTLRELAANGVVWLDGPPAGALVGGDIVPVTQDEAPEGAVLDTEDDDGVVAEHAREMAKVAKEATVKGQILKHKKSGHEYVVLDVIDAYSVRARQLLPDNKPTPARTMKLSVFA